MWTELLTALALVFVLEGLIPFLSPDGYKRYVAQIVELPSASLRWIGLGSMLLGVVMLYATR